MGLLVYFQSATSYYCHGFTKSRTQNWFPRQCLSTYRKRKLVESEKANALHTFEAQSPNTQKKLSAHKEKCTHPY
jgi:hypothetical protein